MIKIRGSGWLEKCMTVAGISNVYYDKTISLLVFAGAYANRRMTNTKQLPFPAFSVDIGVKMVGCGVNFLLFSCYFIILAVAIAFICYNLWRKIR
jgi:hypothetical protein